MVRLTACRLLRFELLDCWADGQLSQQHAWALLPLSQLAELAAEARQCGSDGWGSVAASRLLLLPLCTEYDAVVPGEDFVAANSIDNSSRGPALKIEISYEAHDCTMDAAEACAATTAGAAAPPAAAAAAAKTPSCKASGVADLDLVCRGDACIGGGDGGSSSGDSDAENSLRHANHSSAGSGSRARRQQLRLPGVFQRRLDAGAAPSPQPVVPTVAATLSVEIGRACGLAAAVRQAASAAATSDSHSASSLSLSRAATTGPHAFARLTLFETGAEHG